MLARRGYYNPWPKAIKRYGSSSMYIFLLFLGLLPTLIALFGTIASLVQMLRRRTWYLWPVVVAGPLTAWGLVHLQSVQVGMDPWVRDRVQFPSISFIDIASSLLAHSLFSSLIRLSWSVLPAPAVNAARRKLLLRDRRVGRYLLAPHAAVAVAAACWAPRAARLTPFVQLPFCAYFAFVAWECRGEWGVDGGEEGGEGDGEDERRAPGRLFDALVVAAGGLTVRSILGIVAVALDIYTKETMYPVALAWAIVCEDFVIFSYVRSVLQSILGSPSGAVFAPAATFVEVRQESKELVRCY
ncbi:hypothetical protein SLS58_000562 [Diplodia intermedia]|uniref:Uncharacterized protein n=1 Tax=Diplodia intermedia TaxID=856260 RepID=A0ABR3U3U5_9PEZI